MSEKQQLTAEDEILHDDNEPVTFESLVIYCNSLFNYRPK